VNWLSEKFSNLSILLGLLLVLIAFVILGLGVNIFGFSSDALLSLISAIVGGLIATTSQVWVSEQDRRNQLRLAALEKRLQAHQEAYTFWRKLKFNAANEKTIGKIVEDSQTWWEENCIYLDPKAREAFFRAILSASDHIAFLNARDMNVIEENFKTIEEAGKAILAGVALPTIGDLEGKFIQTNTTKKKK